MKMSIINKIKKFINNLFGKRKIHQLEESNNILSTRDSFINQMSVNVDNISVSRNEILANKIMEEEIDCYDLTNEEAEVLIEYFINDIANKESELQKIKKHIIEMKNKLENNN